MWMMGCNEGGDFNNMAVVPDPFGSGRKLRPLIPKPSTAGPINNTTTLTRIHGNDILSFNHHLEQSKRLDQLNTQQVITSSRWNPTPEQLQILEELYRRGTRTPSTDHIQHITAQLRRYGKIEGKNVFYWFQNHKARERQKRRRQLESPPNSDEQYFNGDTEPGGNRSTGVDYEQTRNWPLPTKFSTLAADQINGSSIQKSAVKPDGWIQYEARELQQHTRSLAERNATWQTMELSFSPLPTSSTSTTTTPLINPNNGPPTTTISPALLTTMDPKLIHHSADQDLGIFVRPYREDDHLSSWISVGKFQDQRGSRVESQTLELFPLRSNEFSDCDKNCSGQDCDYRSLGGAMKEANNISSTRQFFEFLPLKN